MTSPASAGSGSGEVARATSDTPVTATLGGLASWNQGDSLQLVSPERGITLAGLENNFAAYPKVGETTIAAQALNWKHLGAPLVDGAKGETVMITQLVAAQSGGRRYAALARAGAAHGFSVRDGEAATLSATLVPVAQDRAFSIQWKGSQFAALVAQTGAGASPGGAATVAISAIPAGFGDFFTSYYAGFPTLVELPPFATSDFDQEVAYGNPFTGKHGAWSELVTAIYTSSVPVPTAAGVGSVQARLVAAQSVAALGKGGAIAPQLSPVRSVALDGAAFDAPRAGVGTSPTISWEPPALGKATGYAVTVHQVETSDQGVNVKPLATLATKGTSLQLPAALLSSGSSYVLTITALSNGDSHQAFAADYVTAQLSL